MTRYRLLSVFLTFATLGASATAAVAGGDRAGNGRAFESRSAAPAAPARRGSAPSILDSAMEAGTTAGAAAVQRNRRTRRSNPYGPMSYALMGVGGGLAIYGMIHTSGVECDISETGLGCKETRNKAVIFSGLGAAGAGLWLFMKGENERNAMPSIWFDGRTIAATKRWSF